jgi:large subunit ribosomal protein L16
MGSGGSVDYWVAVVKPGTVILKLCHSEEIARAALSLAAYKLPIKTKFIIKDNID